jgi:hypothetical protein
MCVGQSHFFLEPTQQERFIDNGSSKPDFHHDTLYKTSIIASGVSCLTRQHLLLELSSHTNKNVLKKQI